MNGMRNELQKVEGIEAESRYSSATEAAYVGGDFYDLVRLPHHKACIILGDVSGKGVEAASVSAAVKTALSAYAFEGLSPARSVELLNELVLGFSRIETFATMFVGLADIDNHTLTYCSAGHPPALLVRAKDTELVTLGVQSGVVGAFENMHYQDGVVKVSKDDILILYTDGVTEARDEAKEFFGEQRLQEILSATAGQGDEKQMETVLEKLFAFVGEANQSDDITMLALAYGKKDEN
jgi:serine phosphatase RsbU (regulator of sigma subunit)